jgi:hypothetical protein
VSGLPPPPPQAGWGPSQPWGAPAGPYGYGVGPTRAPMSPLGTLATAVTVLVALAGATALLAAAAMFNRVSHDEGLNSFLSSAQDIDEHRDASTLVGLSVFGYLGMLLVAGIVFIVWQYRYVQNAQARAGSTGLGPGWAIGGWLIPCANAVLPAIQLHQSSKASDPDTPAAQSATIGRSVGLIVPWAIAYWGGTILWSAGVGIYSDGVDEAGFVRDAEAMTTGDQIAGVGFLVLAGAAVLAIVLVRNLSSRQARAFARDESELGPGTVQASPATAAPSAWGAPASAPAPPAWPAPQPAQPPRPAPPPPPPPRREPPSEDEPGWGAPT